MPLTCSTVHPVGSFQVLQPGVSFPNSLCSHLFLLPPTQDSPHLHTLNWGCPSLLDPWGSPPHLLDEINYSVLYSSMGLPSFSLELFLHWSPVAYLAPPDLGSSSFSVLSFSFLILFMGFSRQEYWSCLPFPSPVDHILSVEISGEITPERMKGWSQSKNKTQLWMWLVMEPRFDAVKSNIAQEPGMLGPWIKANWKRSNRRGQEWTSTF